MKVPAFSNSGGAGYSSGGTLANDIAASPAAPAPTAADAVRAASVAPALHEVRKAVGDINNTIQSLVSHLEFFVDESTSTAMVKVVDTRTQEVIREFSTGKVLGIAKALGKVQGLLLRDSA